MRRPAHLAQIVSPGRRSARANEDETSDAPSREARFSDALFRVPEDWRLQAEGQPKPRPWRAILIVHVTVLLYVLSAGPAGAILKALLPSTVAAPIWICLYYPLYLLVKFQTPLAGPLLAYLQFWGAR